MNKEEQIVCNRLLDLAKITFNKNIPMYSDFLNLNEQSLLSRIKKDIETVHYILDGGYEYAERKMICFYPNPYNVDEVYFPYSCLKIAPIHYKYTENLSHRDYLGSILGLGIERHKIGDILIKKKEAILFCEANIADFINQNLFKIKNTNVSADVIYDKEDIQIMPEFKTITGSVSSIRLDTVVALGFSKSRGQITALINGGKVFVNGKVIESKSYTLKEEDIISVRGLGKMIYRGIQQQTKKGRNFIVVDRFV
ncbi:RNA-binding protein YlmH [Natranaerovirga hydrolytica]|uniref:RNA-binding protein YlmH n=1 Tax=Natranaerovirga hydrolytica TaxID=680378 RepID=A0A4R1MYA0_9FIRM|nr:YlmH/Sll1252 family protein [Natranaerovirga hydrolytica]TCK98105.1 RNA-binding protein YlmH [Natranaerovirga hydrolytica]